MTICSQCFCSSLLTFYLFLSGYVVASFAESLPDSTAYSDSSSLGNAPSPDSANDSIPQLRFFVKADYPQSALDAGVEGSVILDLLVSDTGSVDSVAIVKTVDSALGHAAAAAAHRFKFIPARFNGIAEPVILQYEYRFSLDQTADSIPVYVNLTGQVLEFGTRRCVPNAMVRIQPLAHDVRIAGLPLPRYLARLCARERYACDSTAITIGADSLGRFSCRAVPSGACSLKVVAPGFSIVSKQVLIQTDQCTETTLFIRPLGFGDENEIVVYGKRTENQISHRSLTPAEVRRVPG